MRARRGTGSARAQKCLFLLQVPDGCFMKWLFLFAFLGALISLTCCSRGRVVIPAHPVQPDYRPLTPSSIVFQLGHELFSLSEDVYYSGNFGIFATNPLHDSIFIDLAPVSRYGDTVVSQEGTVIYSDRGNPFEFDEVIATLVYSGDSISGSFSGIADSSAGYAPYPKITGTFSNVPPKP